MLTAAGVGSGLDVESLISQLMVLERRPLNRLESQQGDVQLQISANGQLRNAIARLQSAAAALTDSEGLGGLEGTSSDEDVLSVSTVAGADTQSHDIEVVRIATTHRLSSNALADEDTEVGTGNLDITVDGETLSLALAAGNNTLAQVRDAINAAEDNPGVTASIINVDAGAQLVLTANDTGIVNTITVTPDAGLAGFSFSQVGTLQDAFIRVDGFDVNSSSNSISGVIAGTTLDLMGAGTSTVSFSADSGAISDAVEEMVNAFNGLRGNIKGLRQNAFAGDSMLLSLESSVSRELSNAITLTDSSTAYLFELGVSFNDEGELKLNSSELDNAVAEDPIRVLDMFAAETTGLATRIEQLMLRYTDDDGLIDSRVGVLEQRSRSLDQLMDGAQFRLDKTEERLRAEFTALDSLIAQLTVTSTFLSQQLLSLPQINSNKG